MTDAELLRRYMHDGSDAAFAELVERHLNLVYSVARRHAQSSSLAEDIAQSVFIELARHARRIKSDTPLIAWLHIVSRRVALNTARGELRRQARESVAASAEPAEWAESIAMKPSPPAWHGAEPLLDETDRTAVLLRYFENKTLREVGAALGTTDDAAQKRVSRALDRLRTFFLRRGVTVTAAGLASDLSAHAITTAPTALGLAISNAAVLTSAGASAAAFEPSRVIVMMTFQKSLAVAAFVVVGGAGLYESALVARQSDDLLALREQTERTAAGIRALRTERDRDATRLKTVEQQIDARLALARTADPSEPALLAAMAGWLDRVNRIKQVFAQRPELAIPEMRYLKEETLFAFVRRQPLDSDEDLRRATSEIRKMAEGLFNSRLSSALSAYVATHDGRLPASPRELAPLVDPPVDGAILDRYEMLQTGKYADLAGPNRRYVMAPKSPPDPEIDSYTFIFPDGLGSTAAVSVNMTGAWEAFVAANPGQRPTTAAQLKPYLKWPMADAAVQKQIELLSKY